MTDRPPAYAFLSWVELRPRPLFAAVPDVLAALRGPAGVPPGLDTEARLRAFADRCGIRVAEPEIEAGLVHPHPWYAHRDWVRAEYRKFLAFCRETGWLGDGDVSAAEPGEGGEGGGERADYGPPPGPPPAPGPTAPKGKGGRRKEPAAA